MERASDGRSEHTLLSALAATVGRAPDRTMLRSEDGGRRWTRAEFAAAAATIAGALRANGAQRGYSAGLLMGNRPEWLLCDMAVLLSGGIPISLYPTASPEQLGHVIGHAEITIVFVECARLAALFEAMGAGGGLRLIVVLDAAGALPSVTAQGCPIVTLDDLASSGASPISLDDAVRSVRPDGLATIVYTSGTTGAPKGVCLTHRNFLTATGGIGRNVGLEDGDRIISWLPHAHVAERTCHYVGAILFGLDVTTCADAQRLSGLLREVEPHWFGGFPRLWEKMKTAAEAALMTTADSARIETAIADAMLTVRGREEGNSIAPRLADRVAADDASLFAPLRARLGLARARTLTTGSAPTPLHVLEFFAAIGLPLREMYGASETCTYGAMITPARSRMGSVGAVAPGMEMSTADDGEILLRGAAVMPGYLKAVEQTAEVFTADGWYRTGDLGRIDEDGFLWVNGRKKELIINASGQNMSPAYIETMIKSGDALIGHVCVIGEGRQFNTALITVDADHAVASGFGEPELRHRRSDVRHRIASGVAKGNDRLARVEQIKRFVVLPGDWLPGGDELTQTLKLRRAAIERKYAAVIARLYEGLHGEDWLTPTLLEHRS